ncbi:H(+)/Cl(-) exchange transporter 3-like [Manduca sexta]|uniref:H(+)/Cl(-) exchange transporter 3-like n=1 Tax=Manduca sexta TaxID=7130 RepID=UPI00188FC3F3|nr:H(+)/Cl(-) exchange transporter 3-like [Manduca sexta]
MMEASEADRDERQPLVADDVGDAVLFSGMQGDDDIPGIGQYDDFHTIDWQRDIARDRMRHRYIVKKRQDSIWDLIKGAHDASGLGVRVAGGRSDGHGGGRDRHWRVLDD